MFDFLSSPQIIQLTENCLFCPAGPSNSAILYQASKKRVFLLDTKMGLHARQLASFVRSRFPHSDISIINTHSHSDHTGGNRFYHNARIIAGAYDHDRWKRESRTLRLPDLLVPVNVRTEMQLDEETVQIDNRGRAHTLNDIVVFLKNARILFTGDLVLNQIHPAMFASCGSHTGNWTETLQGILSDYDAQQVIPGHGQPGTMELVVTMRDYFRSIATNIHSRQDLCRLHSRYRHYANLSRFTGFWKTVRFIAAEGTHAS